MSDDLLKRSQMHKYQNMFVDWHTNEHPMGAGWLDMGMGKTVSTGTCISDWQLGLEVNRTLISAPKRVAMTTWPMELEKWEHLKHLRYSVVAGNERQRIAAIMKPADIHIIGQDNLPWLIRKVRNQWAWDHIVLDEASGFKSTTSHRYKTMKELRQKCKKIRKITELSATPSPNGLIDIWTQMYLLDFGEALGRTKKAYTDRWFKCDKNSGKYFVKQHSKDQIYGAIDHLAMHMSAEEWLPNQPETRKNFIEVQLPDSVMQQYKKMEKELLIDLKNVLDSGMDKRIISENAAVLTGKLMQLANGAIYVDDAKNWHLLHDEKINVLKEIVELNEDKPILVGYNFKSDLQRLQKAFPQAKVMDDDISTQIAWNAGKIPMLLTHPKSSGHGLNLQKGSNVLVWFGCPWSLELYIQLIGRLARQGQTESYAMIHHIVCKGTVDERISKVLKSKEAEQSDLLRAVIHQE